MKRLNVKRVAALAAGAALLGASLAVAEVTYGNVQLVNQNGQPTAQVVVGSGAAASDGVVAANIAAMLGNLAYKAQTISASTAGEATCALGGGAATGGTCAISNEKVKLEVTLPGVVSGVYGWKTLINDYTDKYLGNRNMSTTDDIYNTTTDITGFDVPTTNNYWTGLESTTNKFDFLTQSYGSGAGQPRQAVKKISGTDFTPFATFNTKDSSAADFTYTEDQTLWVSSLTDWNSQYKTIVAEKPELAYRAAFSKGGDNYGIPYCTIKNSTAGGWWGACDSDDSRTDRHRVAVKWLGEDWIISEMNLPDNVNSTSGSGTGAWITVNPAYNFSAGGSVKLAKESSYGVVRIGENLSAGNYIVKLTDITVPSSTIPYGAAVFEIYDSNGQLLKQDRIPSGSTYSWAAPDGTTVKVKVYKATPGYTLTAKWAEMAVYSQEIELKDGQILDDNNKKWYTKVLWKNREFESSAPSPAVDTLWALELINTKDNELASTHMQKGATYNIPTKNPVLQMQYDALDLVEGSDYDSLTFNLITGSMPIYDASCTSGTNRDSGTQLMQVTSGQSNAFTISGQTVSSFYIELQNSTSATAGANGGVVFANTGSCNARLSEVLLNASGGVTVNYNPGDGDQPINFVAEPALNAGVWFKFGVREDPGNNPAGRTPAGTAYDYWNVTVLGNASAGASYTFATGNGLKQINYTDVVYGIGGGATYPPATPDLGFISARGSKFSNLETTSLTFNIAKRPAQALYYVKTSTATPNAPVEVTLGEGEEAALQGGVKIKVASITEDVGACSAAPGSAACTVDQSGVSAVLSTGGSSVTASVPYALSTSTTPLVVLDRDAGAGTLITVGGPAVNSVTMSVLQGSDVQITASSPPTVKAVGNNIVVAGGSAADTIRAGNDFIASLKQS
ncbi:Uncharacterised protein [Candidatus Burarchaeum australiense]|nr:Uncharacterised protein [Candidatus Burarchaeum australiense]